MAGMAKYYGEFTGAWSSMKLEDDLIGETPNTSLKKFKNLLTVARNLILTFHLMLGQDQYDLDNMSPSENYLSIIDQKSPVSVQRMRVSRVFHKKNKFG